jgi:hypothetical protein
MQIGWVPNPTEWERWPEAEALLEPARATADDVIDLLETNHLLWAVLDGDELLAVATARLTEDDSCEVILVGGRDHQRWLKELNDMIGAAAAEAGATRMVAMGRRGWVKALRALGWDSTGVRADTTLYSRKLEA